MALPAGSTRPSVTKLSEDRRQLVGVDGGFDRKALDLKRSVARLLGLEQPERPRPWIHGRDSITVAKVG